MKTERMHDVHVDVERDAASRAERNRMWWERMPMSYKDWQAEDRIPSNEADYHAIEHYLLSKSPFLTRFFQETDFSGKRVLDLGCGVGVLSCLLARKASSVTAADITQQAVTLASENATAQKVALHVTRTDAEALAFKDGAFDYVLSWGVVHHSPNTQNALHEVARVLAPGGRGLLMVYHKTSLVYYLRGLYWLLVRGKILQGHNLETVQDFCVDGFYHRHFRRDEFATCFAKAGLRPVQLWATQQDEPILPLIPHWLDSFLKDRFGWYLVAEIAKPG